jgi:hypothetical protein
MQPGNGGHMILSFRHFAVGAATTLVFLLSCSLPQTTGGGGTETVNTFAMLSNGTPASGAVVRVIDAGGWIDSISAGASAVIESTVADKDGRIVLKKSEREGGINIQIDHSKQGLFSSYVNVDALNHDTLRLQPCAIYSGTLDSSVNALAFMLLSGSAYRVPVSNGRFDFNYVAPAVFAVLGTDGMPESHRIATSGAVTLPPGATLADSGLNASFTRLLVDNFESGVGASYLARVFPCIYGWYAVSETGKLEWDANNKFWKWLPFIPQSTSSCHSFISLDPAPGAGSGNVLEFSVALDSTCTNPFATAGVGFTACKPNGVDFSSMTSFSLRVHGNGLIWIRFETQVLNGATNSVSNYSFPVQLTNAWQALTVPVDSLRILPSIQSPGQYPWAQESRNVVDIEFEFSKSTNRMGDTLHLYLDDFYVNGVGIDVLRP